MRIDALVATGSGLAALTTPDMTVGYIGVPVNVLFACACGTYAAFAVNKEKIKPHSRAVGYFIACMFMGGFFTSVVTWIVQYLTDGKLSPEPGPLAGTGGIVAFCTFFLLPVLADIIRSKEWINWIPFVNRNKE